MGHEPWDSGAGRPPNARAREGGSPPEPIVLRPVTDRREAIFDALVTAFGYAPANPKELATWRQVVELLLASAPPVTPEEVPRLKSTYEEHFPGVCTPKALANNLGRIRAPPERRRAAPVRPKRESELEQIRRVSRGEGRTT